MWVGSNPSPHIEGAKSKGIFLAAHALWHARADLQANYPLETEKGRLGYLAWWLANDQGPRGASLPTWFSAEPSPYLENARDSGITLHAHVTWASRSDLQASFPLKSNQMVSVFLGWWLQNCHGDSHANLPDWLAEVLDAPAAFLEECEAHAITHEMYVLWACIPDLQRRFDLDEPEGRLGLLAWHLFYWRDVHPRALPDWVVQRLTMGSPAVGVPGLSDPPSLIAMAAWTRHAPIKRAYALDGSADLRGLMAWAIWLLPNDAATQVGQQKAARRVLNSLAPAELFEEYLAGYSDLSDLIEYYRTHKKRLLETFEILRPKLLSKQKLLEVGGAGPLAFLAKCHCPSIAIQGTHTDLRYELDLAEGSFDLIIFTEILEHLKDRESPEIRDLERFNFSGVNSALREFLRILKTGGEMILSTPNVTSLINVYKILSQRHPFMFDEHVREFTIDEVSELLESNRFEILVAETRNVWDESIEPSTGKKLKKLNDAIRKLGFPIEQREDCIFIVARKPDL